MHGETNERIDGVDDLQPQPNDLRLRHGAGDGMAWTEVTDADGRQVGLIEGRLNESGLEVTRAHVRVGTSETEAAELLRSHLNGTGHTVGFASTAETSIPSGTRSIIGDLRAPDASSEIKGVAEGEIVDLHHASDLPAPTRTDVSSTYPSDYVEASPGDWEHLRTLRLETGDPKGWIDVINPGYESDRNRLASGAGLDRLNRVHNCCDCARSVQDTLDGHPSVAAAGTFESLDRLEEWAGREHVEIDSYDKVRSELSEPGDSALIVATFDDGLGHAFNAVNIDGSVSYVDAQTGAVEPWPPPFADDTVDLRGWYFAKGRTP